MNVKITVEKSRTIMMIHGSYFKTSYVLEQEAENVQKVRFEMEILIENWLDQWENKTRAKT
jgi:hypothetical protein